MHTAADASCAPHHIAAGSSRVLRSSSFGGHHHEGPRAVQRVRARFHVAEASEVDGGFQVTLECTIERHGGDKPVCVAEIVYRVLA